MNKNILLIIVGLLLISCNKNNKSVDKKSNKLKSVTDSLTSELDEIYEHDRIIGLSVAIVNKDTVLYENGFGYADIEQQKAYTAHTIQNIASISKTLIGLALLKAQEMEKLKLDDPINKYLPFKVKNPYYPEDVITIRHLATHTSTITDTDFYNQQSYILNSARDSIAAALLENRENFNPPDNKISMEEFLSNVLNEKGKWYLKDGFLNKRPGKLYEYSNVAATLAALVIESATGETYDVFTKKHILKPLGMQNSGWSFDAIDLNKHTKQYADDSKQIPLYSLITYPDGGLITSSHDLGLYLRELIRGYSGNGTLLRKESYVSLFKKQLNEGNFTERDRENPYNDEYNTGLFMGFSAQGYIGHSGGDPGVSSYMFFDAKKKIGRILIINTDLFDQEGVDEYFAIWNKLGEYQEKFH